MKTGMQAWIRTLSLLAIVLSAVACTKPSGAGRTVRFKAVSSEGAGTRVSYSGETYASGGDTYERLDWESTDKIKICMKKNASASTEQASYGLSGIKENNRYSTASLVPDGEDLVWGDDADLHEFWGVAFRTGTSVTISDHTVSGVSIPADQQQTYAGKTKDSGTDLTTHVFTPDMSKVLLYTGLRNTPQGGETVSLEFYPAVTTFDFTVGANERMVVKRFEMETRTSGLLVNGVMDSEFSGASVYLTGDATITIGFDSANKMTRTFAETSGTTGQVISVDFGADAPTVDQNTMLNFKVFALPLNIAGARIKFTYNDGGEDRALSLNLSSSTDGGDTFKWLTFPACVKANIHGLLIPGAEWDIIFEGPKVERWTSQGTMEIGV